MTQFGHSECIQNLSSHATCRLPLMTILLLYKTCIPVTLACTAYAPISTCVCILTAVIT